LESYALSVHKLFDNGVKPSLTVNEVSQTLTTVKTNPFQVQFGDRNPYFEKYQLTNHIQKMVSVADVFKFAPDINSKTFSLFASRGGDKNIGKRGESAYKLPVQYDIIRPPI